MVGRNAPQLELAVGRKARERRKPGDGYDCPPVDEEGTTDDSTGGAAPPPAPDRLWRHPAELGAETAAANLAARQAGGRRWPGQLVAFIAGATVVGATWLFTDTPDPTIEVITTNMVEPASAEGGSGPIGFDEWSRQIAEANRTSVIGLHLGGEAPTHMAQATLLRDDGHLLTSAHAIAGASDITAVLHDGRLSPAELVASDPVSGVAVLKIASPELPPPTYSDGRVAARDRLVGIAGQDDGDALVRGVTVLDDDQVALLPSGDVLGGLFRLSNELDGAWAGAPIIDENGGVVAIAVTTVDGTNYAIPTALATEVGADLIREGTTDHVSWLGIEMSELSESLRTQRDLRGGVVVRKVWDQTAAARGGLSAGDVIIGFASVNVLEISDLQTALRSTQPGEAIEIRYSRRVPIASSSPHEPTSLESQILTTTVVLGAQPLR